MAEVDENEERINDAMPYVTNGQIGDSTSEALLKSLGIKNYDVCIVTISGGFFRVRLKRPAY